MLWKQGDDIMVDNRQKNNMESIILLKQIETAGPCKSPNAENSSNRAIEDVCEFFRNVLLYFYSNEVVTGDVEIYENFYKVCSAYELFSYTKLKECLYKYINYLRERVDDNTYYKSKIGGEINNYIFSYRNFYDKYSPNGKIVFEVNDNE